MTHNETEIEKWIFDIQASTDALCVGLRDIVRRDAPADVVRDAISVMVAVHMAASTEAGMRLLLGIGAGVPPVLTDEGKQ